MAEPILADPAGPGLVAARVEPDAWQSLAGMTDLKNLIERRVLLPINERTRAEKHGLLPPGSILLFGPPGTGKTALARATASRLGWAFIEVDLSIVALESARLRRLFEKLFQLEQAVIFFDEFEYLGLKRDGQKTPVEPLTAEMLKGLPALRESGLVLLMCATNHIGLLDPALLRPGRFDLVLPIGLPDGDDRAAILRLLLARHQCDAIDEAPVIQRTDGLTMADLQAVCQRAAQAAFEREVQTGRESRITTEDLLRVLEGFRPTIGREDLERFHADVERFARC